MESKNLFPHGAEKFIAFAIVISFVSGMVGGAVGSKMNLQPNQNVKIDDNVKTIRLERSGSPSHQVPGGLSFEQKTYVEESQSIVSIKKVAPAVVSIVATQDLKVYKNQPFPFLFNSPFGDENFDGFPGFRFQVPNNQQKKKEPEKEGKDFEIRQQKIGGGTGFIITADGMVLTNRHVIANDKVEYTIVTNDGTEYDADVLSLDPLNDLGVVRMVKKGEGSKKKEQRTKLNGLPVVEFGNSASLEIGQKVLAIGYALGQYENTVTSGIISGKGREITAAGRLGSGAETLSGLLQTDAAINPGNSGGPLINLSGQVIGVNVAIDQTGSSIGFAIPINEVKPAVESVEKYGHIVRATLGVRHIILNKARANELKIDVDHGALLVGEEAKGEFAVIPGSPADKAGLKIKDVILSIDGKNITVDNTLQAVVRNKKPGDEITLKVWRSGNTLTIKVKLEEAKDEAAVRRGKA